MKPPLTTEVRTPKTDEAIIPVWMGNTRREYVSAAFSRELERANQVLTEALEEAQKRDKILTDAMCEIKATIEGRSSQPLEKIVAGCQKELCAL